MAWFYFNSRPPWPFRTLARELRRISWQSRSGFKRRRSSFAFTLILFAIFCGLLTGFSDFPLPTFSTATHDGVEAPIPRQGRAQSLSDSTSITRECNIKGNLSANGERIYHVPGGEFYDVTHIDASNGERWFCTEAEAGAAGWRRSMR